MSTTERRVPRLHIEQYLKGSPAEKGEFSQLFYKGLQEYGFVVLTGTAIYQKDIDLAYKVMAEYFSLPTTIKNKYVLEGQAGQRGHTLFGQEHAKDSDCPDLKEFWHVGRNLEPGHRFDRYYPQNIWPEEIPEFKEIFLTIYNELGRVSDALLEALAMGMGLPLHYFSPLVKDGNSILRLIHYPPIQEGADPKALRAAAHGDINLITLLMGATDSGLELLDRDGTWLPVESAPGEIVVDSGDMLSRITNDIIPTTIHRVVNPVGENKARYSMPFFVHPHPEAELACIEMCKGKEGAKYPPINAQKFLEKRLREIGLLKY